MRLRNVAIVAGSVTLGAALLTGLTYVTSAFGSVLPAGVAPWHATASALAVEVGVIFAGLVLAIRAQDGDVPWRLYAGIGLFLLVSMFANADAVLRAMLGEAPTAPAVAGLDAWSKARAALLGSAVPLMVLVSLEALRELAVAGAPGRARAREAVPAASVSAGVDAEAQDAPRPPRRQPTASADDLAALVEADPELTVTDVARELGVSRGTVYGWAKRTGLERNGAGRWSAS